MKKWSIIVLSVILLIVLLITILTGGFTKGVFSQRIYRPKNVYEEIWNLVLTEESRRKQTVLTSSTKDAIVDFDFGYEFVGVVIPECDLTICWMSNDGERELCFLFSSRLNGDGDWIEFCYNYETKTLFGNTEYSYLLENFLKDYFQWCDASEDFSSKYSIEALGKVTFQYVNPIWKR